MAKRKRKKDRKKKSVRKGRKTTRAGSKARGNKGQRRSKGMSKKKGRKKKGNSKSDKKSSKKAGRMALRTEAEVVLGAAESRPPNPFMDEDTDLGRPARTAEERTQTRRAATTEWENSGADIKSIKREGDGWRFEER